MQQKPFADISTAVTPRRTRSQAPHPVPVLTVISHPMPQRIGQRLVLEAVSAGKPVALSRNAPDFSHPGSSELGMPLADTFLSRKPVLFEPAPGGGLLLRVEEGGTQVRVVGEPFVGVRELGPEELAAGVPLVLAERVALLLHMEPSSVEPSRDGLGMAGQGLGIRRVREDISRVADLNVPVLIRGETGTGKELVAQAIHQSSNRRNGPFISVNLGALPKELAAAELFGAQKGAYTGSTKDREGFFRAAHGGTLFLDEVGEAPPEVQVALLRVLETGEVYPVGGHSPVSVDVRLITATDADLEERIRRELFRAPLLHRLAGFEIQVPPLRERREDIGLLFLHFARQELEATGEAWRLSPEVSPAEPWLPALLAERLMRFMWPGNVRQLRNLTRQLIIGSRGLDTLKVSSRIEQELDSAVVPTPSRSAPTASSVVVTVEERGLPRRKPSEVGEEEMLDALRASSWDIKATAERLGITRSSLYELIDRSSRIRTAGDLSPEEVTSCFHECQGDLDAMVRRLEVSKRALQRRLRELGLESSRER
ncbi:sigma-54-dependent Fis family transcriptional regulator [Archangium violaceum]|uniref:sigma 54-interacting transcriptional regulator n=1 Tax=Archangium violaceum TaxID=83451 RepID=UPI00194F3DF8|nr:sigma-54 dependent transcriptional regulator [Archangium violaceum]QRN98121.1 sigma-54-dependent Fis family transcriptional regulator [Archangium violaceum]